MDDEFEANTKRVLADCDPNDIPVVEYGIEAYELVRAMFIVLAREKGTGFAEAVRDELGRRQGVLAESGHPWETSVAQTLLDMQLWDAWPEAGVSGTFDAEGNVDPA